MLLVIFMEVTQELRDILSSGNDNYMNHYH